MVSIEKWTYDGNNKQAGSQSVGHNNQTTKTNWIQDFQKPFQNKVMTVLKFFFNQRITFWTWSKNKKKKSKIVDEVLIFHYKKIKTSISTDRNF